MNRVHGVFPFEPLRRALEARLPEIVLDQAGGHTCIVHAGDFVRAAVVLGVSRRALVRWNAGQMLTLRAADECATALGMHPTAIWDDFNEICDRRDRRAADNQRRYRAARRLAATGSR